MSKKTRLRQCPAAGRAIESFECALGRHTTYVCPEHCQFNSFSTANYSQFLEIETKADEKFVPWLFENVPNPAQFKTDLEPLIGDGPGAVYFQYLAWHGIYRTDPEGNTCIGKWAKADFPSLTTDERIVMRGRLQMRPAIVEVHRILDDKRVEAVDLLDPQRRPLTIVDRGFAARAVRFGVYATHLVPLPHFTRVFGVCLMIPILPPFETEEVIREIISHLGGGLDENSTRRFLAEHFQKFQEAVEAVGLARRRAMFDQLDAQFGKAIYELIKPFEECRAQMDALPEIADDPPSQDEVAEGFMQGRVWFARADDPERDIVGEGATIGRILMRPTHWRLEAMGAARLDKLRERFESHMTGFARFVGERRDNLAARMRANDKPYDISLVPPALLKQPQKLLTAVARIPAPQQPMSQEALAAQFKRQQEVAFLDEQIPALEGKTPRQAATDPLLRPVLLRLMKERVRGCDERNLETGRNDDVNWMVRELALTEILYDPPPPRPRLSLSSDEEEDDDAFGTLLDLAPPPPLPPRPWSQEEAFALLQQSLGSFPKMTEALDYLVQLDYSLFDKIVNVVGGILEDREYQFIMPIISLLVLCFAPRGTRPPEVKFEDLNNGFHQQITEFSRLLESKFEKKLEQWINESSQPELLKIGISLFTRIASDAPAKVAPRGPSRITILILLRTVIDELDRAMRLE